MVRAVIESARGGARSVRRPWLGAQLQVIDGEIATSLGLERPMGVLVSSLYEKGPAAEAGLRRGDVILSVDGQAVDSPDAFGYRFALKGVEGRTNVTVLRGGKQVEIGVKLTSPPETRPREPLRLRSRSPFSGATIVNMSPAVADELQLEVSEDGVVVSELDENGVAVRVGFQKGDQILAINGQRIKATRDVERLVQRGDAYWEITINRRGRTFTTVLGG
jgi:S1-C subfamily serine protease